MNSSKSMNLLAIAHNYEELGRKVVLLTPSIDVRSDVNEIASRVGIKHRAIKLDPSDDVISKILEVNKNFKDIACVLVDEAQFLKHTQVSDLATIVDKFNVPVIAYGLRTDFRGFLFEGSRALMEQADSIEEIKTICSNCGKKAIMNARVVDGKRVTNGDQILIGGNESYIPLCRNCWYSMDTY